MTDKITVNKAVSLAYTLRDDDGEIIDRSEDGSRCSEPSKNKRPLRATPNAT